MKTSPILAALTLAAALAPAGLAAQVPSRVSVAPFVGPTWFAHRYELKGVTRRDAQGRPLKVTVGPTTGFELGLGVELRAWSRFGLLFTGSWASLNHLQEESAGGGKDRTISGDQNLIRFTAALEYRIVPEAPGFFTAGVLLNRFSAGTPAFLASGTARNELGGFGGLGLDVGSGRKHLRAEGRLMFVAPRAEAQEPRLGGGTFEARSTVIEYSLSLAFVFSL